MQPRAASAGFGAGEVAYGDFRNEMFTTVWLAPAAFPPRADGRRTFLDVHTNPGFDDHTAAQACAPDEATPVTRMQAAGFYEGYATATTIEQYAFNSDLYGFVPQSVRLRCWH